MFPITKKHVTSATKWLIEVIVFGHQFRSIAQTNHQPYHVTLKMFFYAWGWSIDHRQHCKSIT